MSKWPFPLRLAVVAFSVTAFSVDASADTHVTVNASANFDYNRRKFANGKPTPETYVFMAGKFFEGTTVDHSIDKLPFRRIAEFLAPELARQQYFPTTSLKTADLVLVVHWGTTAPRITSDEMRGITSFSLDTTQEKALQKEINANIIGSDVGLGVFLSVAHESDIKLAFENNERLTDQLDRDFQSGSNAQLLGYTKDLRRLENTAMPTQEEFTLRANLAEERYFIIIKAYDLHDKAEPGQARRSVWTLYLNMRSPGQNFSTALKRMSTVAVDYFGKNTDGVKTTRPTVRDGSVTLAPLIILGEVK